MVSGDVGVDRSGRRVIRVVDEDTGIEYVVPSPVVVDGYIVSFNNKFYISLPPAMNDVWRALYRRGRRSKNLKLFIYFKDAD
jgi:hypothetical protein